MTPTMPQAIFVRDRQAGTTQRVSISASGSQANGISFDASISSGGRFVAFSSSASNLVANDTNGAWDIFLRKPDIIAPIVTRVAPADGATGAARKANVVATFSEKMKKSTVSKATFQLYKLVQNPDGSTTTQRITKVTVALSRDGLTAKLNPYGTSDKLLAKRTTYMAVVRTGATDLVGNPLDQDSSNAGSQEKAWYFTTSN